MKKDPKNKTELEELSEAQLEQARGGAALWNGKDKFPQRAADRSSVKSPDLALKSLAKKITASGGDQDV